MIITFSKSKAIVEVKTISILPEETGTKDGIPYEQPERIRLQFGEGDNGSWYMYYDVKNKFQKILDAIKQGQQVIEIEEEEDL